MEVVNYKVCETKYEKGFFKLLWSLQRDLREYIMKETIRLRHAQFVFVLYQYASILMDTPYAAEIKNWHDSSNFVDEFLFKNGEQFMIEEKDETGLLRRVIKRDNFTHKRWKVQPGYFSDLRKTRTLREWEEIWTEF